MPDSWHALLRHAVFAGRLRTKEQYDKFVATKEKEMAMSRDRVEFTLYPDTDTPTLRAFKAAFGMDIPAARPLDWGTGSVTIICRPSQFARFLIYRNDYGGVNGFKCLNPKLVPARPVLPVYDVSAHSAEC